MSLYDRPIRHIDFEATSECNARCPQCLRTYHQSLETHPLLSIQHWNPEDLGRVLEDRFFAGLRHVLVNGNYGDIMMHPDPQAILSKLVERGVRIEINTNGSVRSPEFWRWLGQQPNTEVAFAIDGLEDTHQLYRRKTNYQSILRNARAFIEAGGEAIWVMNIFRHNEHQVEGCRKLAKTLGFKYFKERPSTRWSGHELTVVDEQFEPLYSLAPPYTTEPLRRTGYDAESYRLGKRDYLQAFGLDNWHASQTKRAEFSCRAAAGDSVYLSFDGRMWPCCWTASGFHEHRNGYKENSIFQIYQDAFEEDPDFNNVVKYSPTEVFEKLAGYQRIVDSMFTDRPCTSCYQSCQKEAEFEAEVQGRKLERISP